MTEFLDALRNPDIPFLRNALLAGALSGVAFGVMGTYVVTRRISYIAGAVSHCVLGGIGLGFFLRHWTGLAWFNPMAGALLSALAAAVIIGVVSLRAREREDTVIGALWAVGMALGLVFMAKTPGYIDPMSYLFGSISLISSGDVWLVVILDVIVLGVTIAFYNELLAVCFDEEFARLRGVPVEFYYLMLLCLTALTVVLLVRVVGIVLVIALLTLPAAVAGQFSRRLWHMMALASLFCAGFATVGMGLSYAYDLPSGATIVLVAGVVYLAALAVPRLRARGRS